MYYQTVLKKHQNDIVSKIFVAQQNNPSKGGWIRLVQKDMEKYSIYTSEEQIMSMSELDFRQLIKKKIKEHSFRELTNIRISHKKVKHIQHTSFSGPQKYFLSGKLTRKNRWLLYNLRYIYFLVR